MKVNNVLLICNLFLTISCKTKENIQTENTGLDLRENFISLTKGACFGQCPSYKMTINGDGSFTYFGKANVIRFGGYKGQLTQKETDEIFTLLAALNWSEYPNEYPLDNADLPQFTLEYKTEKQYKKVKGNTKAAKEIVAFNTSIDLLIENVNMEKLD